MRLRLGSSRDGEASVVVLDPASGLWVPLVDAVKGGGRGERSKWPHGDGPLRDVTAFLGLGREKRRAAAAVAAAAAATCGCLLYTSPSPRDKRQSRMPSSA